MRPGFLSLSLLFLLFAPQVSAMPGQPVGELEKQLQKHPFFPESHLGFGIDVMHTFKELTQGRILRFSAKYDGSLPPKESSKSPVLTETLLISNQRVDPSQPEGSWGENSCDSPAYFPIGLIAGEASDESTQTAFQACKPVETPSFLETRQTRLLELLEQVYGKNSALVDDFKKATLVGKGLRYFYLVEDTHTEQIIRRKLSIPPIEQQVFRGNRFDFLIMDYVLLVGRKNAYAPLRQQWEQDLAQLRKNAQEADKAKPFDY